MPDVRVLPSNVCELTQSTYPTVPWTLSLASDSSGPDCSPATDIRGPFPKSKLLRGGFDSTCALNSFSLPYEVTGFSVTRDITTTVIQPQAPCWLHDYAGHVTTGAEILFAALCSIPPLSDRPKLLTLQPDKHNTDAYTQQVQLSKYFKVTVNTYTIALISCCLSAIYAALVMVYNNIIRNERLLSALCYTLLIKCKNDCIVYNLLLLEPYESRKSDEAPTKNRSRRESIPPPSRWPGLNTGLASQPRACDIRSNYHILNYTCSANDASYTRTNKITPTSDTTSQDPCRTAPNSACTPTWFDLKKPLESPPKEYLDGEHCRNVTLNLLNTFGHYSNSTTELTEEPPEDSEGNENVSSNQSSSVSNQSYRSRPIARPSLPRNRSLQSNNGASGDDDGNDEENSKKRTIPSQCQNSDANETDTLDHNTDETNNTDDPTKNDEDDSICDTNPVKSPNSGSSNSSFTAMLWNMAKSFIISTSPSHAVSYANSTEINQSSDLVNFQHQTVLSNLSPIEEAEVVPVVSPLTPSAQPGNSPVNKIPLLVVDTPAKDIAEKAGDTYFTGTANPAVTPCTKRSSKLLNISTFSPKPYYFRKSRSRTKSASASTTPYAIPPLYSIRERAKSKLLSQEPDDTPLAVQRKRVVSESAKYDCTEVSFTLGDHDSFSCNRISGEGYHNCCSETFYIQNDFLNMRDTHMLSQSLLEQGLEKILPSFTGMSSQPVGNGETIFQTKHLHWESEEIEKIANYNLLQDLLQPITADNSIYILLSRLNRHAHAKVYKQKCTLNSVLILRAADRSLKVSINKLITHETPISVFLLKNDRALNIIPRKHDPTHQAVYDVALNKLSVASFPAALFKEVDLCIPVERHINEDGEHIYIIAYHKYAINSRKDHPSSERVVGKVAGAYPTESDIDTIPVRAADTVPASVGTGTSCLSIDKPTEPTDLPNKLAKTLSALTVVIDDEPDDTPNMVVDDTTNEPIVCTTEELTNILTETTKKIRK